MRYSERWPNIVNEVFEREIAEVAAKGLREPRRTRGND